MAPTKNEDMCPLQSPTGVIYLTLQELNKLLYIIIYIFCQKFVVITLILLIIVKICDII